MGYGNHGNASDIRFCSSPLPPDVGSIGILGCNWRLSRSAHDRDMGFLPIRSLWRGPIQHFILVSRNADRSFCHSNRSEEDSRQVDWYTRDNQVESINSAKFSLSCEFAF